MKTNNDKDYKQIEKFQNLVHKLKELEKQKIQLSKELEEKQKERQKLKQIIEKRKSLQENTIQIIEQYLIKGKNILVEIRKIISYLQQVQKEQEMILDSLTKHPILKSNFSSNSELFETLFELKKEIDLFKQKRLEIEKKIAHLKDL